ncbi:MAG TPA: DUF998 domain-containing protein [candidate division Zixibacteria bacterium]|nr:DUF998 domain-containing protein [candidate division Zixibacteria bacterium]
MILAFLLLIGIAHYFAQKNGFNWIEYELSGLVFGGTISKTIFIITCISTGICLCIVLIPLGWFMHAKNLQVGYLIQSFVSSIALIGLGIFPLDTYALAHNIFTSIFFVSIGILQLYISIIIFKYQKKVPIFYTLLGVLTFGVILFHCVTRWFFGKSITQRLAVFISMLFVIMIYGYLVFNLDLSRLMIENLENKNE